MPTEEIIAVVAKAFIIIGPIYCIFCGLRRRHKQWTVKEGGVNKTYIQCDNPECNMITRRY